MIRRVFWLAASVLMAATATVPEPPADLVPDQLTGTRAEVSAPAGALLRVGDELYEGPLIVTATAEGVAILESLPPEEYLIGIREVPLSWPDEALKTQAVAARTYLAFTLASGRSSTARSYGYDICATTACQVYAGVGGLDSVDGGRWLEAIAATSGQILLYDGRPAQAMYSSTAGARTRESEDIFPGLDVPYLSAVDSPNEPSPFVNWRFSVSSAEMTALLAQAGLLHGPLWSAQVETTPDGGGPWQVVIRSGTEVERVGSYRFRSLINSAAAQLMPDRLPARRPDGRRYPQTVLSGTYSIRAISQVNVRSGYRELTRRFVFEGQGWGHQVGMSQYGALAMAEAGETYDQILSHYYSGLLPEPAGPWLPASITVGLVVGTNEAVILAAEGASVLVDGEEVGPAGIGVWRFSSSGGDLVTQVPAGLGQAPTVRASRIRYDIGGYTVRFEVTAPAFLDVTVSQNARRVGERAIGLVEAGEFSYNLADLVDQELDRSQPVRVVVATTSPLGGTATSLNLVFER